MRAYGAYILGYLYKGYIYIYRDSGKENGNYYDYDWLYRGYIYSATILLTVAYATRTFAYGKFLTATR